MTPDELRNRTADFAVRALRLADALPRSVAGRAIANQLVRSACSIAANYRAALRGKSRADFINKITIVLEEADESAFWIEMVERVDLLPKKRLASLRTEADELTRIFSATRTTARNHKS